MAAPNPLILLAVPQMADPNFARRVVLVVEFDPREGSMGLITNNPTSLTLGTFARSQNLECHPDLEKIPVFTGGPVSPDRGWILHTDAEIREKRELMPGLFLSGTVDSLKTLLEKGSKPIQLYLGYAGWTGGQLELEMAAGSWVSVPATNDNIFQLDPTTAWNAIFRQMGVDPMKVISVSGVH